MKWLALLLFLALPALAGSVGYGFLGYGPGFHGGGGGFGLLEGFALGGESWGGLEARGGVFLLGVPFAPGQGFLALPVLGLGGGASGQGGFLLDLGVRAFLFPNPEGGWALGLGAGYTLGPWRGPYLRLLLGGGRP
ncbi:hypothetical protein [Thermus oshimai]|uniref:hypothetical protein n=1 Tax=Thermus oshimai TaxID=56957 RepID=UPI0003701CCE|nr:hypothetical protein [Thermus oshimai]